MLLCRRILQAHASNSASVHRLVQAHVRDATFLNPTHVNLVPRESTPKLASHIPVLRPADPSLDSRPALLERVLRISRHSAPNTEEDSEQAAGQVAYKDSNHCPFDAFAQLRAQDPTFSASLPKSVLCLLAQGALRHGSQDIVDSLTADILDDNLLHQELRVEVAASLLCGPRRTSLLDKEMTLSLLTIIRHHRRPLPPLAALHVLKTVIDDMDTLGQLLDLVLGPFLRHLASFQSPMGAKSISCRPHETISLAYTLNEKIVSLERHREAFELFQCLSDHGHVPAEAFLAEVPSPLAHDFAVIIRSTLARACLHWGWYHQGVGFVASIIKSQDSPKRDLEPLALELLHASLSICSPGQFKACAWLMCHLVDPHPGIIIPTQTIGLFYRRAMRAHDCEAAYMFYSRTQSCRVKMMTDYPPPQGTALTWLMRYLVEQKRDVHLARTLAKQVVNTSQPVPRYDRGHFIAMVARQGFATEARALWERYSVGCGREFVVGNAATMTRMVSLFSQRDSWIRARMERERSKADCVDLVDKRGDYYGFARQVLEAFQEAILPLEQADHFDLSALARGYFMLGEVGEGFHSLRILIRRREIPDRHDINVALSAIARQSPRAASRLVNRMVDQGLRPDAITFGTVMHEAIKQGDTELVAEMLDRAEEIEVTLSSKTMVSLIHASVAVGEGIDDGRVKANVQQAWKMVKAAGKGSVVRTPNVGKRCIAACLHVEDPVMAFRFWTHLVRGKTEWSDPAQRRQRRAIGHVVRRHCAEGRLDVERGRAMLRALGLLDMAIRLHNII